MVGIYRLSTRDYIYGIGSAGLSFIYFWLDIKNVTKIDDSLQQSLSELEDTLPDVDER